MSDKAKSEGPTLSAPVELFPTLGYMHAAKRWLVWREIASFDPSKKPRKIPHYVEGRERGTTDTLEDWSKLSTFDEACNTVRNSNGFFLGPAFALGPDGTGGHWQGIDLDDVPQEQFDGWVTTLPGYVEVSPSGKGLHAIGYGRQFATLGSNGTGFEAYASGRYFTFTGLTRKNDPLMCIAEIVETKVAPLHSAQRQQRLSVESIRVDAKTVSALRSALLHMRADDYQLWVQMGMSLRELGETGRGIFLDWSACSDKFNADEAARKWDKDFNNARAPYQTVFSEAQQRGWVNPSSNAAQLSTQVPCKEQSAKELFDELSFDWNDTEPLPPDIVLGLVANEEVTLLGGHGGVGKGFLSLQIAVGVSLGEHVLGHPSKQCRVLYYSAEDGRKRISLRLRQLLEPYTDDEQVLVKQNLCVVDASDLDPLYGETMKSLGPLRDYEKLQKMIEAFDPQLVVIDGASDTFDGNEIARREVRGFIKLLRRIHPKRRIGVLLIAHIDRSSARGYISNDDGYAGNAQWHNSCRRRLFLQRKVERDEETKEEIGETITLRVMKNQDGPPQPDMEVIRQPDGFWQRVGEISGPVESAAKRDHAPTILRLIDEYYRRSNYISTSLAANAPTGVYAALKGDKDFPSSLNRKRTIELARELQRAGKLEPEEYKRKNRSTAERWKVTAQPDNQCAPDAPGGTQ